MKRRRLVVVGVVAALAVAGLTAFAAVGGFGGKGLWGARGGDRGEIGALIVINALELSEAQMKSLLDLTTELSPIREAILGRKDELKAKLIAFKGTREELQTLLKEFREEGQAKVQEFADKAIAGLKTILTTQQWEVLYKGAGMVARARLAHLPAARMRMPMVPFGRGRAEPHWEPKELDRAALLEKGIAMWMFRHLPDLEAALKAKLQS